jgi:hypothetical protein
MVAPVRACKRHTGKVQGTLRDALWPDFSTLSKLFPLQCLWEPGA